MCGRANPFEWSGGHPALDLVNTLDERPSPTPIENLATYHDLTSFAALAGLLDRRTAARLQRLDSPGFHVVKHARKLREHLHDVLAAANSTASAAIRSRRAVCCDPGGTRGPDAGRITLARIGQPPLVSRAGA